MHLIHKFRVIHIIEGDMQFIAQFFYAKKMMQFTERHGYITDEQYGSRKHRMAQSAVLNKIAYYKISHQSAFMDDDARACYDHIVISLSSAECQRWGLSHEITKFTNTFLETQQYHVRSAYGVSPESYTFTQAEPIQGYGQGVS